MLDLLAIVLTYLTSDFPVFLASLVVLVPTSIFLLHKSWHLPPGPRWRTPILGNMTTFAAGKDMRATLLRLREQYGEVYRLYLGQHLVVVINGIDALKEIFEGSKEDIIKPALCTERMISQGHGLTQTSVHDWLGNRNFCADVLNTDQSKLGSILKQEMSSLVQTFKARGQNQFDPYIPILSTTCKVMCSLTISDFDNDDDDFKRIVELTEQARDLQGDTMLTYFLPFVKYLPGYFCRRDELKGVNTELENIIQKYMTNCREIVPASKLLQKSGRQGQNICSDLSIQTLARDLLYSGTVVTAMTITNVLSNLVIHQALQERLFREIVDVLGNSKQTTESNYNRLVFTKSFIMETMRLNNLTLVGFPGILNTRLTFRGHVIPKDTVILPDIDSVMMNPEIWGNPEEFEPDRFITGENMDRIDSFMPFFLGCRQCPGRELAMTEILQIITTVVQRFKLLPSVGSDVRGRQERSTSSGTRPEFLLMVEERQ